MVRIIGAVLGLGNTLAYIWYGNLSFFWWFTVALLASAALVLLRGQQTVYEFPTHRTSDEIIIWSIALVCLAITLAAHRPDADDAFYINLAVGAVDFPDLPILQFDTIHGIEGVPISNPIYQLHSYEMWNSALSLLTGIPVIHCFHHISAAIGAVLTPLVHAKLFRLLTPRYWVWSVVLLIAVLLVCGDTHHWNGNFAFVRMWQGKSILVSIFIPLVYTYAMRFGLTGRMWEWLLLCASITAAVGSSSTGLWAAPAAGFLGLCVAVSPNRRGIRILFLGLLGTVYVLILAILIKEEASGIFAHWRQFDTKTGLDQTFFSVLGRSHLLYFGLACVGTAWVCCKGGMARRFAIIVPFIALVTIINPYLPDWLIRYVVGFHRAYWRVFWVFPAPVLMVLVLSSPLQFGKEKRTRFASHLLCFFLVVAFAILIPKYSGLSERNGVRIGVPRLKIPEIEYHWAKAVNESVQPGSYVVAPKGVSVWIPTFPEHAYPLVVRNYTRAQERHIGEDNYMQRSLMQMYVDGQNRNPKNTLLFKQGLSKFNPDAVCLEQIKKNDAAGKILKNQGFFKKMSDGKYEIWVRGR